VELLDDSASDTAWTMLLGAVSSEHLERARSDVDSWLAAGLDVRSVLDPRYPTNLQAIYNKPPLLFTLGYYDDQRDGRAVAVVGTRTASTDGLRRATRLGRELAEAGVTVLSGMAKGIDAHAHIGALRAGGRTIAVMGTGILQRYPKENSKLADAIIEAGGALLSQFFPNQPPTRWTFPKRNVTMSGLSVATVVVEAGATSGAKMQAEAALTHGRSVFLPSSLVAAHPWARRMVTEGFKGTLAVEIQSTDDLLTLLDLNTATPAALTA
jgi:DNA processing protein